MGYLKIKNLYQAPELATGLLGRVYCLEKIHGTSAHVSWDGSLKFFSGGEKHERFVALFDQTVLEAAFVALGYPSVVVHGEAYGGKQQGMGKTYGPDLKFVAFDVKIGETWLSVPDAHDVAKKLGLAFVHYVEAPATVESLDRERDMPSVQAALNGTAGPDAPKIREGIVIRPLIELQRSDGSRVIAKHKRAEFGETATPRVVDDPVRAVALADAQKIAAEWVTPMRLVHVMGSIGGHGRGSRRCVGPLTMSDTPAVISAMIADIRAESEGEINWDADKHGIEKAIGRATAKLFKEGLSP